MNIFNDISIHTLLIIFFIAILADFITGVLVGAKEGRLKSRICGDGIFRSAGEVLVLVIFCALSYLIPAIIYILSIFLSCFIFKEGLSIIENLIKLNVYVPNCLKKMLEVGVEQLEKIK